MLSNGSGTGEDRSVALSRKEPTSPGQRRVSPVEGREADNQQLLRGQMHRGLLLCIMRSGGSCYAGTARRQQRSRSETVEAQACDARCT